MKMAIIMSLMFLISAFAYADNSQIENEATYRNLASKVAVSLRQVEVPEGTQLQPKIEKSKISGNRLCYQVRVVPNNELAGTATLTVYFTLDPGVNQYFVKGAEYSNNIEEACR